MIESLYFALSNSHQPPKYFYYKLIKLKFIRSLREKQFEREENDEVVYKRFHKFEAAALINLRPTSVDEAQTIIPSLQEFTETELEQVLNELDEFY